MTNCKQQQATPQKQRGYTLVELAIAIAILAVLIVAGLAGVNGILRSGKISEEVKTLSLLRGKISANFAYTSTSGISATTLYNMGALDPNKSTAAGVITSAFNTSSYVGPNGNATSIGTMAQNTGFVYTITNVPKEACSDLAGSLNDLSYAVAIQEPSATAALGAAAFPTSKVIKAGGDTTISKVTLATACGGISANTLDMLIALKP